MIPKPIVDRWKKIANWPLDDQVEQDLIISCALVEIFNHDELKNKIAFRGGTALHKLIFPKGLRYSEDIDLNRLENGPAGGIIDAVKDSLKDILGEECKFKRTNSSLKFIYKYDSVLGEPRKLKIEINVREICPHLDLQEIPFKVESKYFTGETVIKAFDSEEMLATKMRALYQRSKGRDLFDLYEAGKLNFDWDKIITSFLALDIGASQAQFKKNLEIKMENLEFLEDLNPILADDVKYDPQIAFDWFIEKILPKI